MKIYHYTNIEALALILKNQTIRFNRLDKVDDIEEGNAESWGVKFCKYVFVSCWTDIKEENIPLWKMYSGNTGGIRIALEQEMFKEYLISDLKIESLQSEGSMISKISPQDMINPNFFIIDLSKFEENGGENILRPGIQYNITIYVNKTGLTIGTCSITNWQTYSHEINAGM